MSETIPSQGKAEVSCQRCYRRKKRCDKLLPECNGCRKANVPCSFPQDSLRQASFTIEYVRGLKRRVAELEQQLAEITASSASSNASSTSTGQQECDKPEEPPLRTRPSPAVPDTDVVPAHWTVPIGHRGTRTRRSTSLADGLKMLFLEATAERYVGSSSGLAFAKLTQAMLWILLPDQEAFVFGDGEEGPGGGAGDEELLPPFEDTLDFLDLDMMLDSPQQLTSLPINAVRQGSEPAGPCATGSRPHTLLAWLLLCSLPHTLPHHPATQLRRGSMDGSTTYCSVTLMDETESIQLFDTAMPYFEAAMGCGELAALEVLMLQVSYSFFNSAGPSLEYLSLPRVGGFRDDPWNTYLCNWVSFRTGGQIWQDRAYEDIRRYYPDVRDAWTVAVAEEKVPYIDAIIKEAGRYYTVSSMSLPRKTVTEINWNGAIIPPKTMVLINAQAGNHDTDHFGPTGNKFNPERWLSSLDPATEAPSHGLAHLSFGAGSRNCSGQFIASRLLYTALVRILSSYRIIASEDAPPNTNYVDYSETKSALVAIPRDFRVGLVPRDSEATKASLNAAEERTRDHCKEE
ncbi:cytochrome P450 [Aspergillus recurvatus]